MPFLPEQYTIRKFMELAGKPKLVSRDNMCVGSCNICREDSSWLKRFRLHYYIGSERVHCFNCGYDEYVLQYIADSTGCTTKEVMAEARQYENTSDIFVNKKVAISLDDEVEETTKVSTPDLPSDVINLFDNTQLEYYKNNSVVTDAMKYLYKRRMYTAINKPKAFYISLTDFVHKNRIIVPSYDIDDKIIHYQSRSIYNVTTFDNVKYLSKKNSNKSVFNINNVVNDASPIFIFEGAFNSCFCKNGVAISGIDLSSDTIYTKLQKSQLDSFPFARRILVLDNQWVDDTARKKSICMVEQGHDVFIWPEKLKQYKDINDLVIDKKLDALTTELFTSCVYDKHKALNILYSIKNPNQ